ncbi:ABC-type transport system involved in multi-copper enzyme maturation, permease component [Lentzea fradiae]|uniref:ABC-type transport system involved in multi-copper enzyme maturation, permease component n=1 Tax=Lentzea fradiae TaxID=200378 RepID=A0A1G7P9U1_9PSEU|nr:ABC transporter permease subunit [Lentzea fradiae]SDF82897.1 ABC-type transport system involved in multi-copper enzyme maturation, permease component [Lentzea fradiae]
MGSVKAELLRLWKWPATWVLIGVWLVMTLSFGYVFNYIALDGGGNARGMSQQQLVSAMQPENVGAAVVRGLPMFGGAIILVLAALAVGSGYGWGTWKTTLTAGPSRVSAMAGTLGALAVVVVVLVALTFAADLAAAVTVASLEGWDWSLPGWAAVEALGASLLIAAMWTAFGVFLGVVTKGPALAVGLGLMWAVVTENLLRGVGSLLGPVESLTEVLPGGTAGNLAGAVGGSGAPGVLTNLSGTTAALLLLGYVVVFTGAATLLKVRRDLV